MKILFASSEVAPFIKTGGLADVAGSLPQALAREGHEVKVILPLYEGIGQEWREQMTFLKYFNVTLSWRQVYCGIFQLEREGVAYWFVDNEYYFKRWQLYGHFDDCERFAFFSRAIIETPGQLDWAPDIIHCNDWQTALVPVYLLEEKYRIPQLGGTKSVFTIHNIEYQGRYGDHRLFLSAPLPSASRACRNTTRICSCAPRHRHAAGRAKIEKRQKGKTLAALPPRRPNKKPNLLCRRLPPDSHPAKLTRSALCPNHRLRRADLPLQSFRFRKNGEAENSRLAHQLSQLLHVVI